MRRRFPMLAIVVVGGLVAIGLARLPTVLPGQDGSWIVRKAQEHSSLHSFSADAQTRVCCQDNVFQSDVKVIHVQPDRCRIEYVSGPLRGVVMASDGKTMWRYDPKTGKLVVGDNPGCPNAAGKLRLLLDNHRVEALGTRRVAQRDAHFLVVRPRVSRVIRKRLWVDTRTFVVLAQDNYDSRGKLQSSTRFKTIRFTERFPDTLFEMPEDAKITVTHREPGDDMPLDKLSEAVGFAVRTPGYLPKGYTVDAYRLYTCPCECPHESAYIRFTNGLSSISIFESKSDTGCAHAPSCTRDSEAVDECRISKADRGETTRFERNGISYVIVADVDSTQLKKIADSLK